MIKIDSKKEENIMRKFEKAVVLLNMGGPNSLDEVGVFLKNMFADPCILSVKNNMFRSMMGSMIVNSRIEKSKKIYENIGGSSPITPITFSLTQKLQSRREEVFYTYAMRYVPPFALDVLREIAQKDIQKICLFSMYPQYSSTTTFSSFSDAAVALRELEFSPEVKIVDRYFNDSSFIDGVCDSIIASLESSFMDSNTSLDSNVLDSNITASFTLILSAHSIPISRVKKGDPYKDECETCLKLISEELESRGFRFQNIILSYQSKVGPVKWLEPNTQDIITQTRGNVIIYPLSFMIDNSETLYELHKLYRGIFEEKNGKDKYRFIVCPCFNDSDSCIKLIEKLCL